MKKRINYKPDFLPNQYYHCYNHAVGDEQLFREKENYSYFLDLYKKYIAPISVTYAYCLMPNHYHFLIRIASVERLKRRYLELKPKSEIDLETINWHKFVTRQFGNFFNAYAKAINKRFNRRGALFEDDIKRPQIDTEAYFLRTLRYIHQNPIHHGFVTSLEDWDFTSYSAYLSTLKTGLYKTEVLNRFGNLQTFCEFHQDFRILLEFDGMD